MNCLEFLNLSNKVKRRTFLRNTTQASLALSLRLTSYASVETFKLGLITDLHQDIMHDADIRLEAFLNKMAQVNPHAIVQMGDFAVPKEENRTITERFNNAHENALHVIGNHDTDGGFTTKECMEFWGMTSDYYSKNIGGYQLIVLNGNDKGSPTHKGGYASYISPQQMEWLQHELEKATKPILIISHQPLAGTIAVDNAKEVQGLLTSYYEKIIVALNGHSHINDHLFVNKVNYIHLNSASYYWVGAKYSHQSYSAEIHKNHPYIEKTCPYKESIFAWLEINPEKKSLELHGRQSEWKGKSPSELNFDRFPELSRNKVIAPKTSDRSLVY